MRATRTTLGDFSVEVEIRSVTKMLEISRGVNWMAVRHMYTADNTTALFFFFASLQENNTNTTDQTCLCCENLEQMKRLLGK